MTSTEEATFSIRQRRRRLNQCSRTIREDVWSVPHSRMKMTCALQAPFQHKERPRMLTERPIRLALPLLAIQLRLLWLDRLWLLKRVDRLQIIRVQFLNLGRCDLCKARSADALPHPTLYSPKPTNSILPCQDAVGCRLSTLSRTDALPLPVAMAIATQSTYEGVAMC